MGITAEEVMTEKVTTVQPNATLSAALEVMQEQRIRHLPVVDGDQLVGMLSDRDLQSLGFGVVHDMESYDALQAKLTTSVSDAMSSNLLTVTRITELGEITDLLIEEKVGAVPVTDGDNLVGIISYVDVLRAWRDGSDD